MASVPPASGFPALTPSALRVLHARYLRHDARGEACETPEQLFERVASAIAEAEPAPERARWAARFHAAMRGLLLLPNSPTLMNAGVSPGQLSACFVLPIEDSIEGIFETVKQMALVQSAGGGTGFSFSKLRPAGSPVGDTGGRAGGPLAFLRVFDAVTQQVQQGGKRRGANMGVLRCDHPDVLELVRAKRTPGELSTFNLSIGVTDAFMRAVQAGTGFALVHPQTGAAVREVDARALFAEITASAWKGGDPGLLFLDAIERDNPTPARGRIEATNPCGEVPLLPYESCNLASINLARMLKATPAGVFELDEPKLRETARLAVRMLDDVIEVNRYPVPAIGEQTRRTRKIGLGVMGFAELLIRLDVSYDSEQAEVLADRIMATIAAEARLASQALAEERGPFPDFANSRHTHGMPLRNATCTAIAPTGTISILADTSASIEPLFALAYRRRHAMGGAPLSTINPLFLEAAARAGADADRLVEDVRRHGRLGLVPNAPPGLAALFTTSMEVPPERQLRIQAAFQWHVDNSVSKTIQLAPDSTPEQVAAIYRRAFELGLKGITVFRHGSLPGQVVELGLDEEPYQHEHAAKCDPHECKV